MAIATALLGFNNLGCSVTPTFLFRNRFYLQLSPHCPKTNKKSMWEVTKISSFLSSRYGILPSCGCRVHETMVAKCELVLYGTSTVSLIHLMGPLKQSLVENISLQRCNGNIFGLTDTMALFAKEAGYYRFSAFFRASSLQNEVGDPPFFITFLTSLTHYLSMVKFPGKNQCSKNLARTC